MQIDNETKIIASIASKQTNLSSVIHNTAYQYLGLNLIYIPFTVSDLKNAILGAKALKFAGVIVSMPFKEEVMKYIDKIDDEAKYIKAVNVIVNRNNELTGYNTDWTGALTAIKEVTKIQGKTVVVIGAGGVARAIVYGLVKNKAKVYIFNRTTQKAKEIAEYFKINYGGEIKNIKKLKDYDILINATSVGFYPDTNSVMDDSLFRANKIVLDVVIKPVETTFISLAKKKNCITIPGYRMLLYYALYTIKLLTGKEVPFKIIEKALLEVLK